MTTSNPVLEKGTKRQYIRSWHMICNSKIDFNDFWLSLLFVALGIHMYKIDPVDKVWYYESISEYGIHSSHTFLLFLSLGLRQSR